MPSLPSSARWIPVLLLLFPLCQAQEGFAGKLAQIEQRIQAEQKPWYQDFHATRSAEEREALLDEVPGREFEAELQALATEARGTEVALAAWTRLFGLAKELRDEDMAGRALERITAEHLDSAGLDSLCRFIGSWARPGKTAASEAALRKMIAGSPHAAVRAAARFHLAVILAQAGSDAARAAEAGRLLRELGDSSGDLAEWKTLAESGLYELEHLRVGQVAPDFEAVDQAHASFHLSDYRGRVVLLHFWGFW